MRWLWPAGLLLLIGVLSWSWFDSYQKRRADPCSHETTAVLTQRHPQLQALWERQFAALDEQEARHKIQRVMVDLQTKRGTISAEGMAQISLRQIEELEALVRVQGQDFGKLCRQLEF